MSLTDEEKANEVDIDDFDPIRDENGDIKQFHPRGEGSQELQEAIEKRPNTVWTGVDCEDACDCEPCSKCQTEEDPYEASQDCGCMDSCECETFRIVAAYHFVNRDHHVITRKPWVTGDEWY